MCDGCRELPTSELALIMFLTDKVQGHSPISYDKTLPSFSCTAIVPVLGLHATAITLLATVVSQLQIQEQPGPKSNRKFKSSKNLRIVTYW